MKLTYLKSLGFIFCTSLITISCSSGSVDDTKGDDKEDDSGVVIDKDAPPLEWQEHWFEHEQLLTRISYNKEVVVYYDSNVDPSISWPQTYMTDVWKYTKSVYGEFGEEGRLYVILHTNNYGGGHPGVYMDAGHDYRNVVDVAPYDWTTFEEGPGLTTIIHELGHIVEGATNGIKDNPAWDIWKDSKWAEIFIYDVYLNTGHEDFAKNVYDDFMNTYDDYPRANTQWFKNWFYPIYSENGGNKILKNFYNLLADNFPTKDGGTKFARRMNMGEFIHFWSGAANKDLKAQAQKAFGWSLTWENQLDQARKDFSKVTYNIDEPAANYTDVTANATITVSVENKNGKDGEEGSSKLIDNNPYSKFFINAYTSDFWAQQTLTEASKVNMYALTSGNDLPDRDPKSWKLLGSNDGNTWYVVDEQSSQTFSERSQTKEYSLNAPVEYSMFKLEVTENAGSTDFQLGEWRLFFVEE
ncbi:discoidin domain-containing protein [Zhouia sp. PK063]|uniref:discoidin domain-containing protein n=1 Tax=Zhouia sp. PK063 TaxID=3373602 RepID=UPI00378A9DF4